MFIFMGGGVAGIILVSLTGTGVITLGAGGPEIVVTALVAAIEAATGVEAIIDEVIVGVGVTVAPEVGAFVFTPTASDDTAVAAATFD
mmetsp:Transcript_59572/g.64303  ORF Transcript_59572/g.64303 Transcript_59572/m.64303 type:complete len:88 (+) Transcript_59572:2122-2385(+)